MEHLLKVQALQERIANFQEKIAKNENRIKYTQLTDKEAAMLRSDNREYENEINELKLDLAAD